MHLIFSSFSNYFNKYLLSIKRPLWGFWKKKIDAPAVFYIIYGSYLALSLYQRYPRETGTADAQT